LCYIVIQNFKKHSSNTFATDIRSYKKRCSKSGRVAIRFRKERETVNKTSIMNAAIALKERAYLCTLDKKFHDLQDLGLKLFLNENFINQI